MDRAARALFRRLALGVPLVALPLTGCGPHGICARGVPSDHVITAAQHALLAPDGAIDQTACEEMCRSLDAPWLIDGAAPLDAGVRVDFYYDYITCGVDRRDDEEILRCTYTPACIGGRAPAGLVSSEATPARGSIAAHLAQSAHLEAASVAAFLELARELESLGATADLVHGALRAANDERRHARILGALAARAGAERSLIRRIATRPRGLVEFAADNAIEGCVREAYAALVAAHQASASTEPDVREAYRAIARDESRHALLSFAIHDWARERLDGGSMAMIDGARLAWRGVLARSFVEPSVEERDVLGLPSVARARGLLAMLG